MNSNYNKICRLFAYHCLKCALCIKCFFFNFIYLFIYLFIVSNYNEHGVDEDRKA